MRGVAVATLVAALVAPAARAEEGAFAFATLENGTSIGFALVRTGAPSAAGAIGEAALPRSNSVSRVLWDRDSGAYFGYRVEVHRRDGERPFRIVFAPLDRGAVERALRDRGGCPGCPPPAPLGAGPQFPAPQQLAEGDALTLELLANPSTGERIYDVVRLSAAPLREEAMRAAAARVLEGQQAVRRAGLLVARGRYALAAEEYRRALDAQPSDASIHNQLGICYQRLSNDAMAHREYQRALELRPRYAEVWNNVGTLEQSRRRFKSAVRAYKKAIDLKPSLATPWKNLANAYLALGQPQEAFEAYEEALRLDPTILEEQPAGVPAAGVDAAAQYALLAKLLAAKGQVQPALDFLERAKAAGYRDFRRIEQDPDFRDVVATPRYRALAEAR
jgi:tetratricopeptide (TPR) repeat protein